MISFTWIQLKVTHNIILNLQERKHLKTQNRAETNVFT